MSQPTARSLEACIRAWRTHRTNSNESTSEDLADSYFSRGEFDAAINAYAAIDAPSERVKAKRGWCLAIVDRCDEAASFLTAENCGSSSAELAVLAAITAGGWSRSGLYPRAGVSSDDVKSRKAQIKALVGRALKAAEPDRLAFVAYKDLTDWYDDREAALVVAERAISLHQSPPLAEWYARLLRTLGRPDAAALNALLKLLPDEPWSSFVEEMFDSAVALSRYDDASDAIDLLEEKLRPEQECRFDTRISLLRAYLDLRRALDADPGAAAHGHPIAAAIHAELMESRGSGELVLYAAKLRLALAVFIRDDSSIREAAISFLEVVWSEESEPEHAAGSEMMWVGGFGHIGEFGDAYKAPELLAALPPADQTKWKLLSALLAVRDGAPAFDHRQFIAEHGLQFGPLWAASTIASILLVSKTRNAESAGRVLVRGCAYGLKKFGRHALPLGVEYPQLPETELNKIVDGALAELETVGSDELKVRELLLLELAQKLWSGKAYQALLRLAETILARAPENMDAMFYAALANQDLKKPGVARPLYERLLALEPNWRSVYWNLTLVYEEEGAIEALENMVPGLQERAAGGEKTWVDALDRARKALPGARQRQAEADFRSFVRRELGTFPELRAVATKASDLTLSEAAALIALLRAGDFDHSTWQVAPFGKSKEPFEPTSRFRTLLLDLAQKGVVGISECTPQRAFVVKDGSLQYFLHEVYWQINSHTLALQASVRDLSKSQWPTHWTAHAETLSRDLATEECIAYMKHLAEERGLESPEELDARAMFRELLEHSSASKCWYYIEWGVKSTNDTRTKHPIARNQHGAMMLKRTQQMAQRCRENGWETSRSRIQALPRSHFSAALHDVLTGWGERAFDEPIRTLAQTSWASVPSAI